MSPVLPNRRIFLVWLTESAEPSNGIVHGRVEHVKSGRRSRFDSQHELDDFIAEILAEETPSPAAESESQTKKRIQGEHS